MDTIIYIGGFELPDKNAAGHRVLSNGKLLQLLGYNVIFLDASRNENLKNVHCRKVNGFDVWSLKYPSDKFEWMHYLTSIKTVTKIISKYENVKFVICYNYQSIALIKLMIYCRKKKIKIISDVTEWYEDKRLLKNLDTSVRMKLLNKHVDGLICISFYLENYYKEVKFKIVLPPLIDQEDTKWREEFEIRQKAETELVYSGNPGKNKDELDMVIKAIISSTYCDKYILRIIGLTKEQFSTNYPEMSEIIETLNDNVVFMGRVNHTLSLKYVKLADFQIFIRNNSRMNNAGFPTKFVESMACGTPVITTRTSDLQTYVRDGINGFFVDYNDVESLRNVLLKSSMLSKPELDAMKKKCREITEFDYKNYYFKMEKFINSISLD